MRGAQLQFLSHEQRAYPFTFTVTLPPTTSDTHPVGPQRIMHGPDLASHALNNLFHLPSIAFGTLRIPFCKRHFAVEFCSGIFLFFWLKLRPPTAVVYPPTAVLVHYLLGSRPPSPPPPPFASPLIPACPHCDILWSVAVGIAMQTSHKSHPRFRLWVWNPVQDRKDFPEVLSTNARFESLDEIDPEDRGLSTRQLKDKFKKQLGQVGLRRKNSGEIIAYR